jgi:hypothetical protein
MHQRIRRVAGGLAIATLTAATASVSFPGPSSASGGHITEVVVAGAKGVPADAGGVSLQVTVTNPHRAGFLTAFPCGTQKPLASNVNFLPGETRSNLVLVPVGKDGKVCVYSHVPSDLVVDVYGSFQRGGGWRSVNPFRVRDTRSTVKVGQGQVIRVPVAGQADVGASATAASLSLTAVNAEKAGFLTAFPCGQPMPPTSNVNYDVGNPTANLAMVRLGGGEVCIYSHARADVIVDVTGWTDSPDAFNVVNATRLMDSRLGNVGKRGAGSTTRIKVGAGKGAAVLNVISTEARADGYLRVFPCAEPMPATSNVNDRAGQTRSNLVLMTPDAGGDVCVYSMSETHLVVDLLGWLGNGSSYRSVSPARLLDTRPAPGFTPATGRLPDVPSNFSKGAWLGDGGRIPASTAWEPSGSFRSFCAFSHLAYDDPIVYPGKSGAAHLHAFFGNTRVNASSDYTSLRSSGDSTCQGGPLNRTGYWVPALHNASGKVVVPDYFEMYYKGNGTQDQIRAIQTNPNGLRMIAGHDMAGQAAVTAKWQCVGSGSKSVTIPNCASGQKVKVELRFPMCWNGRDLDSPNHRSHMAYGTGGDGWFTAQGGCPSSHPIHLPELTLFAVYPSDGNSSNWYLSSDRMPGMTHANGSTFHADWFGAWDNGIQETWTQKCIREMRTCVFGELGDGTLLKNNAPYSGPKLLDPPSR